MSTKKSPRIKRAVKHHRESVSHDDQSENTDEHPNHILQPDPDTKPNKSVTDDKKHAPCGDSQLPNGKPRDEPVMYRWAAEFLAGPGGYLQKEEIVSDWFSDSITAKEDALKKAHDEVQNYPYSRGRILKLLVEDNAGTVTEISNVKNIVPCR